VGALPGWDKPRVLAELRQAFGSSLMIENDVDAAALAEHAAGTDHLRGIVSAAPSSGPADLPVAAETGD
jgi:predicted NBD/HSP70 family sugar kinase